MDTVIYNMGGVLNVFDVTQVIVVDTVIYNKGGVLTV